MKSKKNYPEFKHVNKAIQRFIALCFPFSPPTKENLNAGIGIIKNYLLNKIEKLYKYRRITDSLFDDLDSGAIRCNNPINFNDPFDYYPVLMDKEYFVAELEKRALAIISREYLVPKGSKIRLPRNAVSGISGFHEQILDGFRNKMQVSCFSTKFDEILMWSHYADSHRGICIEYELNNLKLISHILPVLYVSEMFDATEYFVESFAQFFVNLYRNEVVGNSFLPENFNPWSTTLFGLIKHDRWRYEDEWRLIFHNDLPGVDLALRIKSVFLGLNIAKEFRERIFDIAQRNHFDVYSMYRKREKYQVDKRLIYCGS